MGDKRNNTHTQPITRQLWVVSSLIKLFYYMRFKRSFVQSVSIIFYIYIEMTYK